MANIPVRLPLWKATRMVERTRMLARMVKAKHGLRWVVEAGKTGGRTAEGDVLSRVGGS